jgi:exonuclease SbcC
VGLERDAVELGAVTERIEDLEAQTTGAAGLVADRRARLEAAEAAAEEAATAADEAREQVRALERAHSAHVLRGHLVAGKPCPVCEQQVAVVPIAAAPAELDGARAAEKEAEDALRRARKDAGTEGRALATAEQESKDLSKRIDEQSKARAGIAARLRRALGERPDYIAEVEERRSRLEDIHARVKDAQKEFDAAREAAAQADAAASALADEVSDARSELVHAAGVLGEKPPALKDPAKLLAFAERLGGVAGERLADAHAIVTKARSAEQQAAVALADLRESVGLGGMDSVEDARSEAKATRAGLEAKIEELEKHAKKATELDAREKEKRTERGLYHQLADDFRDIHFVTFLLEDRRRLLSELGSAQFKLLTGRYRFDDDATFNVVDELDADKKRDVDTLSGGELFLASLALALGLADAAARHGWRLQCFFLDEGFGSLDPESLDAALDGIENIVRDDRLIGLVSHVAAVAERVEDKIELEKGSGGMTVIRSGAMI